MGLDFTIYYIEKDRQNEEGYEAWDTNELCYGRKSWELVHALNLPTDWDGEDPEVSKEDWVNLMKQIEPISKYFDKIEDAYGDSDFEMTDEERKRYIRKFENWYDRTFNEGPTLGYEFALGYIREFYEANEKVMKYFDDDNYVVKASVSW